MAESLGRFLRMQTAKAVPDTASFGSSIEAAGKS
jgi:hypothetical protein